MKFLMEIEESKIGYGSKEVKIGRYHRSGSRVCNMEARKRDNVLRPFLSRPGSELHPRRVFM